MSSRNKRKPVKEEDETIAKRLSEKEEKKDDTKEVKQPAFDRYAFDCTLLANTDNYVNSVFSPLGIKSLLSLFRIGASEGSVQDKELSRYFPGSHSDFAKQFVETTKTLSKINGITTCNVVAINSDIRILESFQKLVGEVVILDKLDTTKCDKEVTRFNEMGNKFTNGQIPTFLKKGDISPSIIALFVNLLNFFQMWDKPFDKSLTSEVDFTDIMGNVTAVRLLTMRNVNQGFFEDSTNKILKMKYVGGENSFFIIMNKYGKNLPILTTELLQTYLIYADNYDNKLCVVQIPEFTQTCEHDLIKTLTDMGITSIFKSPDFSQMLNKFAEISVFKQKASITVNAEGTKASAITHASMKKGCRMQISKNFTTERPFIYGVENDKTKEILFLGKYVMPTKAK